MLTELELKFLRDQMRQKLGMRYEGAFIGHIISRLDDEIMALHPMYHTWVYETIIRLAGGAEPSNAALRLRGDGGIDMGEAFAIVKAAMQIINQP